MSDDLNQGGGETASEAPSTPAPAPSGPMPSARESIARAFDDAGIGDDDDSPQRLGEQEGFNRDPATGRFTQKDSGAPGQPSAPVPQAPQPQAPQQAAPQPVQPTADQAPARFNAEAKAAWAQAHPALKGEFHRAMTEMSQGLQQYQAAFEPLKPHFQMAQQSGVPLHQALDQYVSFERALVSEDPDQKMAAIQELFRIAGVDPRQFSAIVMGQEVPQRDQVLDQYGNKLQTIEQQMQAMNQFIAQQQEERALNNNMSALDRFAQTHPRIDEPDVSTYVHDLLLGRMRGNLAGAYEEATRLIPAPQPATAPPSNGQPPAQSLQTRKGQLSIHGAPPGGSVPPGVRAPATRRGAIASAFDRVGV